MQKMKSSFIYIREHCKLAYPILMQYSQAIISCRGMQVKRVLTSHTEKSFLNHVKSNQICIVITFLRSIWHQTEFRLVLNQSEKCNHNTHLV